ncbi:hypothetical protein [Methylomonas sp. MgM2]
MKPYRYVATHIANALCCSLLLSGCANLEAVGEFARGAKALSDASGKFYEKSLESDRQLAMLGVDLGAAYNSPECRKKDASYLTPWDCAVRGENLLSETRRNRAAVAALGLYAQALNEIASFKDDAQIEKTSEELSGNLIDIAKTLDIAVDTKESALATAIIDVAKIYVDLKVRTIVYEKVKQAQEPVSLIVQTLKEDIKHQQQRVKVGRINAKATREQWFDAFRQDYQNPTTTAASKAALSIAAGHLVEDELFDLMEELPNKQFLANLERTADSCLKAHAAIQDPDLKDRADAVKLFVKDAKNLLSSAKRLAE